MKTVREQYERYPYPPVPALALPRRQQGAELKFELGARLAASSRSHAGIRILVAGCGTLEALVAAQVHPLAREVVAFDLSEASLKRLRFRYSWARLTFRKLAPLQTLGFDLESEDVDQLRRLGKFDYILASNVLHHLSDPAAALSRLSSLLSPEGILRLVTYPKASRLWMRETTRWLKLHGLEPKSASLRAKALEIVARLPSDHPIRGCFESHQEIGTEAGLVDAFLHARENPLSPQEWEHAAERASLRLIGETQTETSRSEFLDEIIPKVRVLDRWKKLQILDDFLELCANPILWFTPGEKRPSDALSFRGNSAISRPEPPHPDSVLEIPSQVRFGMKQALLRSEKLLGGADVTLEEALVSLKTQVGPRVAGDSEKPLSGLAISDYDWREILKTREPWSDVVVQEVSRQLRGSGLRPNYELPDRSLSKVPGRDFCEQYEWLQVRFGPSTNLIRAILLN